MCGLVPLFPFLSALRGTDSGKISCLLFLAAATSEYFGQRGDSRRHFASLKAFSWFLCLLQFSSVFSRQWEVAEPLCHFRQQCGGRPRRNVERRKGGAQVAPGVGRRGSAQGRGQGRGQDPHRSAGNRNLLLWKGSEIDICSDALNS